MYASTCASLYAYILSFFLIGSGTSILYVTFNICKILLNLENDLFNACVNTY